MLDIKLGKKRVSPRFCETGAFYFCSFLSDGYCRNPETAGPAQRINGHTAVKLVKLAARAAGEIAKQLDFADC